MSGYLWKRSKLSYKRRFVKIDALGELSYGRDAGAQRFRSCGKVMGVQMPNPEHHKMTIMTHHRRIEFRYAINVHKISVSPAATVWRPLCLTLCAFALRIHRVETASDMLPWVDACARVAMQHTPTSLVSPIVSSPFSAAVAPAPTTPPAQSRLVQTSQERSRRLDESDTLRRRQRVADAAAAQAEQEQSPALREFDDCRVKVVTVLGEADTGGEWGGGLAGGVGRRGEGGRGVDGDSCGGHGGRGASKLLDGEGARRALTSGEIYSLLFKAPFGPVEAQMPLLETARSETEFCASVASATGSADRDPSSPWGAANAANGSSQHPGPLSGDAAILRARQQRQHSPGARVESTSSADAALAATTIMVAKDWLATLEADLDNQWAI